ncbi:MAG: hypothetical protein V4685_10465 [Bacteroidota bacterium]
MRKIYSVFLTVILFAASLQTAFASEGAKLPGEKNKNTLEPLACPVPGIYTIGPGGDYASITFVISELSSCPSLTGAYIFEFKAAYVSTVETFPVLIPNFTGSSAANTITFRPELGATALSITSSNATGTVLFDGGDHIAFDGRPGGAGITKELTIQNSNVGNSYAIRFVNDATNNTITYCNVRSANNNASGGTIILAGTTGSIGNDDILIDNNSIFDAATGTPNNAVISSGSAGTAAEYNNNVTISNNRIYNFCAASGDMTGVKAVQGSSDWIISNNNFYYTFGVTKSISGMFSAISAYNSQMSNFTITGNYIGNNVTGGTPNIQLSGGSIQVLRLSLNPAVANSIQGNTIWNINFNSLVVSPLHCIINFADGTYNFGTITGNNIGNTLSVGNIAIGLGGNANTNMAIINCGSGSTGMGAVNIINNLIGNVDLVGTSLTANLQLINFEGGSGTYTINNNTLGSNAISESVNNYFNTNFTIVHGNISTGSHSITNNSINKCLVKNAGSNGYLYGIRVEGNASYNISGNTINTLQSSSTNTAQYHVVGIHNTAIAPNQIISGNTMYIFNAIASSVSTGIAGIYYNGPNAGNNIVERNFIHSLAANSSVTSTRVTGIHVAGGTTTYRNNMVRMGINSAGGNITTAQDIEGIHEEGGTNNFYFNSVYIGSIGVGAGNSSYAFKSDISTNVTRSYLNNIFYNARSNASLTTPAHYAMQLNSAAGVTSNYNILYATGTGRMLANFNGTDISMLSVWRSTVGGDVNSMSADPQFVSPNTAWNVVDLHIRPSPTITVVESGGVNIASVTNDYDLQTRSTLTPTDIGADAGNFTAPNKADMSPVNLLTPTSFACLNATTQVRVVIRNYYSNTVNFATSPVTINVAVTGAVTTNLSGGVNTGTLAPGDSLVVTIPGSLNMSAAGTYNFSISTTVGGGYTDIDVTNNIYTTSVTPGAYNIGTLLSSVANFCNSGIPVLTLTGTYGTVQWQESTISNTGPWTNVGTNSLTYVPASILITTYYQAVVSCGASNGPSNVETVLVIPASVANTAALANGVPVLSVCEGSSITLTQTGGSIISGAQWQWYEGTPANNFITPAGSPTTAADAATVITPTINATYYLRASGGTAPCDGNLPASNTGNPVATVIVNVNGTWLGNNTNWNDNTNWCGGLVPTATTDAFIPTGLGTYPIISTTQSVRNITIYSGAAVTLSSAGELTIKGNHTNTNGTITNNGKIILNGTSLQSFPGSTATVGAMNILETDNAAGISIDRSFTISGKLQPTNGTVSLNNNDITIKSDATATANVGQLGGGAAFNYNGTGKFVVERYVPARRAWRLLTAPVTIASGATINSTWQEGATQWPMGPATPASNPNDGYGVHISGGTNANGYDQNVNGNPSIKVFSAGVWNGMSVATSLYTKKVTDEPGYMLFVRGSRAVDLTFGVSTVPNNTVLRTNGHLKVANVTPLSVTSTGLTVVGNPFASAINFNSIATLNGFSLAENKYYLWDPSLTGLYGVGAWVTLAYNGSTYDRTVSSFNDYTSSGGSQGIDNIGTIQSGAAFMMDFGGSAATINFNESIKIDGSSNLLFRTTRKQMRANLYVERDNDVSLIDGVLVTYNPSYSNNADGLDVNKLSNFSENFGLQRQGKVLAIERRRPVTVSDTIFLNIAQMRVRNYQFAFEPDSMNHDNLACYLEDTYLHTKTPVSLVEKTVVPFSISTDANAARDRFRLVFNPWIHFSNCKASFANEETFVTWAVTGETDLDKYEIERSTDGLNFSVIGNAAASGNSNYSLFKYKDPYTAAGVYYYRIKASSKHDVVTYSDIARVTILKVSSSLYVFPNPAIDNKVHLQVSNSLPAGEYHLKLLSTDGKTVNTRTINHPGGRATYSIRPDVILTPGIYQLEVILPGNSRQLLKVMMK